MVETPWGKSDSLRKRMLRPGPGTPRDEVVRNQRNRLFGAMTASVAVRGYKATRVSDLVEVSGVSSRTFYDLFPDKRACFLAAIEAMIEAAVGFVIAAEGTPGSWEEQSRRGFDAFAEMIVAQPAAARMFLIDAYAAGPEVLEPAERAVEGFELMARKRLAESPERAEMPPEMISAYVGAMAEIARTRLLRGKEAELPGLMAELREMTLSYRPPSAPLSVVSRPPAPKLASLDTREHAERALRAFTSVVAEQGYANTTVDQVVKRASMSATTFYAHFKGKEDAMMAAIDSAGAQMVAVTLPAFRRAPDWPQGIRAGLVALFNYLASRPALARLIVVEVYAAGPAAIECRTKALRPLERLLMKGHERSPEAPAIATEMITGGLISLAYRQIRDAGPEALTALVPLCTYLALAPFVGAEEAYGVAIGQRTGRVAS